MALNKIGTWGKDDRGYHFWKYRAGGVPIVLKRKSSADLKVEVKKKIAELNEKGRLHQASTEPTMKRKLNRWLEEGVKPFRAPDTYRFYSQHAPRRD
jgi:hypothetical protein